MKIVSTSGESQMLGEKVIELTFFRRVEYALKGASLYFLIALCTIIVPVLHFILVPLFLIISIVIGISRLRKTKSIDLTNTKCPTCSSDLNIRLLYFHEEGLVFGCDQCQSQFKLLCKSSTWHV